VGARQTDYDAIWQCLDYLDDTVLDKSYSFAIEGVRRQWSGNTKTVIKGIGVVNCLYYEPAFDKWWIIALYTTKLTKQGFIVARKKKTAQKAVDCGVQSSISSTFLTVFNERNYDSEQRFPTPSFVG
jgi:hypothetical protein